MGDFETFYEDAKVASRVLGIALTHGAEPGRPVLADVPVFHSNRHYIHRLLETGHSVAVCDQMEDPALAKGVVNESPR
jgi:DNA mismatch repair protein MutS